MPIGSERDCASLRSPPVKRGPRNNARVLARPPSVKFGVPVSCNDRQNDDTPEKLPRARWSWTASRLRSAEALLWLASTCILTYLFLRASAMMSRPPPPAVSLHPTSPVTLISYSYFEKDHTQRDNLEFFIRHGQGVSPGSGNIEVVYTVSGRKCSPCQDIIRGMQMEPVQDGKAVFHKGTITEAYQAGPVRLLRRHENVGMDFGNHNITLMWLATKAADLLRKAKYFVFLNSSVKGPFVPSYFSAQAHWSQAFTGLVTDEIKVVGPSLVCLPSVDAGGPAARLESFVFATDHVGLRYLIAEEVFNIHEAKRDIILQGEYGLTRTVLERGYSVATLLYRYEVDTDWRDPRNWNCNDQVHPSRDCSYGGISQHPFETVFVKSSWGVASKYVEKYSEWADAKINGTDTHGVFDKTRYRLAQIRSPKMCNLFEKGRHRIQISITA